MKSRRREINIFSISALDLFASGMGAFMLLAVVGLMFFPNLGDSEERIEEIKQALAQTRQERDAVKSRLEESIRARRDLEERVEESIRARRDLEEQVAAIEDIEETEQALALARQERDAAQSRLEESQRGRQDVEKRVSELQQKIKEIEIPDIDVVVCLDVTGSMKDQIEGLQQQIVDLANVFDALAPSTGIGVVAFGDRKWRRPLYTQEIVETSNVQALQDFVDTLSPAMGYRSTNDPNEDEPEAVAMALDEAVGLNWRAISQRRYIIVVTDNPAYYDKVESAKRTAAMFASTEGRHVSTVRANYSGSYEARAFLMDLAEEGNGEFVDAAGGASMIAGLLLAVLGK